MNKQPEVSYKSIQDSLTVKPETFTAEDTTTTLIENDTSSAPKTISESIDEDSTSITNNQEIKRDSIILKEAKTSGISRKTKEDKSPESKKDTLAEESVFYKYNFSDSANNPFNYAPIESFLTVNGEKTVGSNLLQLNENNYQRFQLDWTLIIGLICITLLLSLKRFYQKFISQVVTTIVNYQLAEKMLREKNIVVRRAFFILNLNFVLILSLFLFTLTIYWEFRITEKYIIDYLIILGIVGLIIIARLILLYITGFLFGTVQAINEHLHISFLVNKNLGLFLLPVVFIILYSSAKVSEFAIYLCIGMLVIATIYKIFRGFQIIIRNGVLIFYAILYLCTLELLPLVIGSKLIISLR